MIMCHIIAMVHTVYTVWLAKHTFSVLTTLPSEKTVASPVELEDLFVP
jgi:hypothetical protein